MGTWSFPARSSVPRLIFHCRWLQIKTTVFCCIRRTMTRWRWSCTRGTYDSSTTSPTTHPPLCTAWSQVNDGLFHTVELLIQNRSLSLVVDNGAPKSMGKLARQPSVDHNTQLYIGGVPPQVVASGLRPGPERSPQTFNGCIHNVRINGEPQDLQLPSGGRSTDTRLRGQG
ncbi:Slit-like protein 3 protein [Larimichthys crocea]|uniref:Uncharacterized protein n=1 Tax=Larimichthys crocea TaxID=215358 RepID=A0ACD3RC77_LARCR|nr:Slit-like protein 3 protein [Larimichthys crocea]